MFAVIIAGASGKRFWPASRQHLPRQFPPITSERTMFEETDAEQLPELLRQRGDVKSY